MLTDKSKAKFDRDCDHRPSKGRDFHMLNRQKPLSVIKTLPRLSKCTFNNKILAKMCYNTGPMDFKKIVWSYGGITNSGLTIFRHPLIRNTTETCPNPGNISRFIKIIIVSWIFFYFFFFFFFIPLHQNSPNAVMISWYQFTDIYLTINNKGTSK